MSIWDGDTSQPEWEREADWRGGQHENAAELEADKEGWRGELHLEGWPESLAGPEYWLRKRELDDGDE